MDLTTKTPTRAHYYPDDECGGAMPADTVAWTPDEVSCGECITRMYAEGVLEKPRDN